MSHVHELNKRMATSNDTSPAFYQRWQRVISEALELVALQARLAVIDWSDARPALVRAGMFLLIAALLIPVATLMFSISLMLGIVEVTSLPWWAAALVSGLVFLLPGLLAARAAVGSFTGARSAFGRSASEVRRNLQWLRSLATDQSNQTTTT